jgi:hypothetical protein
LTLDVNNPGGREGKWLVRGRGAWESSPLSWTRQISSRLETFNRQLCVVPPPHPHPHPHPAENICQLHTDTHNTLEHLRFY